MLLLMLFVKGYCDVCITGLNCKNKILYISIKFNGRLLFNLDFHSRKAYIFRMLLYFWKTVCCCNFTVIGYCVTFPHSLLFQMQNNSSHINYGFYYGEERPPVQVPGNPQAYYPPAPQYYNTVPAPAPPINTHYTATSGHPHTTVARKGTRVQPLSFTSALFPVFSLFTREATYLNILSYTIFFILFKPVTGHILFISRSFSIALKQHDQAEEDFIKLGKNIFSCKKKKKNLYRTIKENIRKQIKEFPLFPYKFFLEVSSNTRRPLFTTWSCFGSCSNPQTLNVIGFRSISSDILYKALALFFFQCEPKVGHRLIFHCAVSYRNQQNSMSVHNSSDHLRYHCCGDRGRVDLVLR